MITQIDAYERRNQNLYLFGKGVSVIGTALYTFAVGLYVLNATGSGEKFALTLTLGILPNVVIAPLAGVIVDRLSKRKLAVVMDVLCMLWMGILWRHQPLSLNLIYVMTFCINVTAVFYGLAVDVMKPQLVSQTSLLRLNGISKMIDGSAAVLAPILGGMLIMAMPIQSIIALNGVSYMISAMCTAGLVVLPSASVGVSEPLAKALKAGISYFKTDISMFKQLLALLSLNFYLGFAIEVPIPFVLTQLFNLDTAQYGFVNSGFPLGLILGTLFLTRRKRQMPIMKQLANMNLLITAITLLMAVPLLLPVGYLLVGYYFMCMMVLGYAISNIDVPFIMYLQTEVPEAMRGRVLGIGGALCKLILPMGLMLSGILLGSVSAKVLIFTGAMIGFMTWLGLKVTFEAEK